MASISATLASTGVGGRQPPSESSSSSSLRSAWRNRASASRSSTHAAGSLRPIRQTSGSLQTRASGGEQRVACLDAMAAR